ncbi:MAG: hypothetical protein ACJAS1_006172 [Oleiphilaceae bacterium]|jgi:hypothetical protein
MSTIPTIRVKSDNQNHREGFIIRNSDDLRYGEILYKADEFESLGEHKVRLKLESSPSDEFFVTEARLWLELKEKECSESETAASSAREIESLSIAKEHLKAAERQADAASLAANAAERQATAAFKQARWARWAAIIAIIIAIITAKENILSAIEVILNSL